MIDDLLKEIEEFLSETGMAPYRFGILAAKNGRLVERMRAGATITLSTAEKIQKFLAEHRRERGRAA